MKCPTGIGPPETSSAQAFQISSGSYQLGDGAGVAPEGKRRAGDPPLPPVGFVVLVVERGRGAVLLADRMNPLGITEVGDVCVADLGRKDVTLVRPGVEHVIDQDVGRARDELLGYRFVGGEERPHPESQAEVHVRAPERLGGGDDVEHGETVDGAG